MRYLILILLFLLLLSPAAAQEDRPRIFLTEELFSDTLEIVSHQPVISYDSASREIFYFDVAAEIWQTIPFPEGIRRIFAIYPYAEQQYLVVDEQPLAGDKVSLLDIRTGSYSEITMSCNSWEVRSRYFVWEFISTGLCNIATGEQIPYPPEILALIPESSDNPCHLRPNFPQLSPEGNILIIPVCTETNQYLYRLDMPSGELRLLMQREDARSLAIFSWLDNETAIVNLLANGRNSQYKLNLTTGDAELILEDVVTLDFVSPTESYDDRYQFVALSVIGTDVWVYLYDYGTQELSTLGSISCPSLPFDCGDFEQLKTVSPDGEKIVLQVNTEDGSFQSYIIAPSTGQVIHSLEPEEHRGTVMRWLDKDTLYYYPVVGDRIVDTSLHIYKYEGIELISERVVEQGLLSSSDGRYIFYWEDASRLNMRLLDLLTENSYPVLTRPDEVWLSIYDLRAGEIEISIVDREQYFPAAYWRWRVAIPENLGSE
jgi:hypothetical protein